MKNLYVLIFMMLFSGCIIAQSINKIEKKEILNAKSFELKAPKLLNERVYKQNDYIQKKANSLTSRWYNYASSANLVAFPSGGNLLNMGKIFPDTTVKIQYTDGLFAPWLHSVCTVLDPLAAVFDSDVEMNLYSKPFNCNIKVDSLELLCYYRRHIQNPDIIDTLEVEVLQSVGWYNSLAGNQQANYSVDTLFFPFLSYDSQLNYADPGTSYKTPIVKFKVPLTPQNEADTTDNGLNVINFEVKGLDFSKIQLGVGATIRFIPGYTWIPNQDILNTQLNEFNILSFEENGTNTYPTYHPKENNSSYIVPSWSLFDPKNGWHKAYIPSWAFTQSYVFENHWISFHIVSNNIGISENQEKSVKLSQNTPNPADNSTLISYELTKANDVNLVITDLTGKMVMQVNQGNQTSGVHSININTSGLSSGMYYYTLNVDNSSLTRKMIVSK